MKQLIYLIILLCFTVSCRNVQYVPVETIKTEYRYRDSIRTDSVYQKDSIFLFQKGDSIYQYRYKYLYKYLLISKTDTVLKADSIPVAYPVEKQLSRWQSLKLELGGWAFGGIILLALLIAGWFVYKR